MATEATLVIEYENMIDGSCDNASGVIDAGCMAALDAEHYLQGVGVQEDKSD
ncbi:unnamed protein product [Sphenostylis stenocarpa]|uniref:Uncharacterized protein n=1 Tax=Sphenostylis stenocarpa TaxID=92480 RepID=A0AA86S7P2_9FABA|nr:unnamed protein product [Sphenostylis stenocarpa]